MEKLQCHVKNYAWGKKGMCSEVAQIYSDGHKVEIDDQTSYAELWMGTHPDGPAKLARDHKTLSTFIAENTDGVYRPSSHHKHLPFIMKIMSIEHTLSLQVHPTKEQAAKLNDRDPINYPDRNHKPELAYALTRFELLCGFRPAIEIAANILAFDELKTLMGDEASRGFMALAQANINEQCEMMKASLTICFKNFIKNGLNNQCNISHLLDTIICKFDAGVRGSLTNETIEVMRKMIVDFPGDVGCFSPLLLNHIILMPGECCYYAPQELHAYLSGECVECVGCSNNTVRAACTPKFVDIDVLCDILSYRMTDKSYYLLPAKKLRKFSHVKEFAPDCTDFILHEIEVQFSSSPLAGSSPHSTATEVHAFKAPLPIPCLEYASIMVFTEGKGVIANISDSRGHCFGAHEQQKQPNSKHKNLQAFSRGDIFYIKANAQLCFIEWTGKVVAFRTFSSEDGPDHSQRRIIESQSEQQTEKIVVQKQGRAKYLVIDDDAKIFNIETDLDGIC